MTSSSSAGGQPRLIALDWGTTALRAYLLGDGGNVIEKRDAPWGIMHTPNKDFAAAFRTMAGEWLGQGAALPAIAAGMIGSAQGWAEVPYCPTPAKLGDLAASLREVPTPEGTSVFIVPGVASAGAIPNVMRGEETEIVGALDLVPSLAEGCLVIHPGTHSKWVHIENGEIRDFTTYMTGEVFAVMSAHSILGAPARTLAESGSSSTHWDGFEQGVTTVRDSPSGLWPLLFSARSLVLWKKIDPATSLDYLSGLLIGEELRCARAAGELQGAIRLALIGNAVLNERYGRALDLFASPKPVIVEAPSRRGLWRIATEAGLVG